MNSLLERIHEAKILVFRAEAAKLAAEKALQEAERELSAAKHFLDGLHPAIKGSRNVAPMAVVQTAADYEAVLGENWMNEREPFFHILNELKTCPYILTQGRKFGIRIYASKEAFAAIQRTNSAPAEILNNLAMD